MQPMQQYYYDGSQSAQPMPGMQQATYGGTMPGLSQQQRPPHLNGTLQQPSPPAPSGPPYALPGFSPMPGHTQQRPPSSAAPSAAGGGSNGARPAGAASQSTAGKIMRAQHLGGASPQVHVLLPTAAPPPPMYHAAPVGYQPGMVLVQQPQQAPHYQQAVQVRAPFHHYHVPLPRPPPPQQPPPTAQPPGAQQQQPRPPPPQQQAQQPRQPPPYQQTQQQPRPLPPQQQAQQRPPQAQRQAQQRAPAQAQANQGSGQVQGGDQKQATVRASQQGDKQGDKQGQQQQQQRQGGGAIMRPQQLSPGAAHPVSQGQHGQQGQHTSRIMRPTTHAQSPVLPRPMMYHPSPPPQPGPMLPLHSSSQTYLLQPAQIGSPSRPMMPAGGLPPPPAAGAPQQAQQVQQLQGGPRHAPLIVAGGGRGLGGAGAGPRVMLQAPGRKQKKREVVPPVEKLTQDPVPRAPLNEAERKEIAEWVKERKKHFPSAANVAKKEQEVKERAARGELDLLREERRRRLQDIIARQQSMGLAKAAGTLDMYFEMSRGSGRGPGRGGGRGGRGRGREWGGRGGGGAAPRQFGYEAFLEAGDAPQHQQLSQHASGANTQPVQQQRQQGQQQGEGHEGAAAGQALGPAADGAQVGEKRKLEGEEGSSAAAEKRLRGEGEGGVSAGGAQPAENGGGACAQAPESTGMVSPPEQQLVQQGTSQHYQQQWEPRGRGGRGRGRGRGGRDGGFVDGRGWGRGRGRERGRGRVSWQDPQGQHQAPRPQQQQQQQQQQWRQPRPATPTLLQKLLAKEIRQDHSYLLQAFRFFVTNNFLLDPAAPLTFPQHEDKEQQPQEAPSLQELLANPELAEELSDDDEGLEPVVSAAAVGANPAALVGGSPTEGGGDAAAAVAVVGTPMEEEGEEGEESSTSEEDEESSSEEEGGEEGGMAGGSAVEASPAAAAPEEGLYARGAGEEEEGELLSGDGMLVEEFAEEEQMAEGEGMEDVEFS